MLPLSAAIKHKYSSTLRRRWIRRRPNRTFVGERTRRELVPPPNRLFPEAERKNRNSSILQHNMIALQINCFVGKSTRAVAAEHDPDAIDRLHYVLRNIRAVIRADTYTGTRLGPACIVWTFIGASKTPRDRRNRAARRPSAFELIEHLPNVRGSCGGQSYRTARRGASSKRCEDFRRTFLGCRDRLSFLHSETPQVGKAFINRGVRKTYFGVDVHQGAFVRASTI
jgi:hypothetical protein